MSFSIDDHAPEVALMQFALAERLHIPIAAVGGAAITTHAREQRALLIARVKRGDVLLYGNNR